MAFFEVCAKCGHVGRGRYVDKVFAVISKDGREAASIARQIPRVKHHQKDAIRYVKEIDYERFCEILSINELDPYFMCTNIQEQRLYCNVDSVRDEKYIRGIDYSDWEDDLSKTYFVGKDRIKNPRKYLKYCDDFEFVA